MQDEVAK